MNYNDKTIYKHIVEPITIQVCKLPADAEILSVQVQENRVCIWFLCDPTNPEENRFIEIVSTGEKIHETLNVKRIFIGTVQMHSYVFHIFERVQK